MSDFPHRRRLRAAAQNAVLWGAGFFVAGFTLLNALLLIGLAPDGIGVVDNLGMAIRMGVWGGICGLVFSAVVGWRFTGRRLAEIRLLPFALGSAAVIGLFVPLALQAFNMMSGDGLVGWDLVLGDGLSTGVFAGIAAGVTLKLAQVADRILPPGVRSEDELLLRNADAAIAAAESARVRADAEAYVPRGRAGEGTR